ncbi:hypothetical protein BsWGS_16793 [Bradybaena similaris]
MDNIQEMRMASLAFSAIFICTFLSAVCGQTPVVSTSTITIGEKFSFYCDSSRVTTPTGVGNIYSLTLNRTVTGGNSVQVAQYISLAPAGVNSEIKNAPTGRQWNITFTGANGGTNNIGTMKIVVDVSDTQCSDAGMYYCQIVYYSNTGGISKPASSPGQNVTASMGLSEFGLTAVPVMEVYQADDNVTFTCTAKGPLTGVSFNWELWVADQNGYLSQQSLPNNAEPVTSPATLLPGNTGCQQYSWVSTLNIQVPSDYDSQTYRCIVSYQQQQLSGIKTIGTTVSGQTLSPVVSPSAITSGDYFSLYCDSTRVSAPPRNVASIYSLALYRNVTDGNYTLIAQYTSVTPPGVNAEIKNPPNGRPWYFTFTGANNGINNIASMKIVVNAHDAQCSDAGMYYCEIVYFYAGGGTSPPALSPGQNVTVSMSLSSFTSTADPDLYDYEVDDNVTFTCAAAFQGPSTAVTFSWGLYVTNQFGSISQLIFPNNAVPVTNPPTLQPSNTSCQQYSWVSTLSIQVPPSHRFQLYMCLVSDQRGNSKSLMKAISVIPRRTQTSTSLPQNCTSPSSQAVALRNRRTPSALVLALLLLASILLVKHPYARILPVSCLSCLIVGSMRV